MGTNCAPAYASIFMNCFQRKYTYPFLEGLSLTYLRFNEVKFFIWTGRKDQLIAFLNDLNTKQNSVEFECKISQSSTPFLDMEFYIKNNKLYTKNYREETDRQDFLHVNSEHTISLKNSQPCSQVLKVKCACSMIEQKFITKG